MTDRMKSLQPPQSQDDVVQVSQRAVERYHMMEKQSIDSRLGSEAAYRQSKRILNNEMNLNTENSPDSSIEFLGYKKRPGCVIEKDIQNPLRKILHRKDRCTELSMQFKPQTNEKLSDESGSLSQSFFANLLDKNTNFHSKTISYVQNRGQMESKVRNIEDLFEDVFLIEIQKNPLCTLMQKGKKERDRSYQQSQSQQVSMGIRLINESSEPLQLLRQKFSPNYPQAENNNINQPMSQPNSRPVRPLRSNTKAAKKQIKYEKRMKNIQKSNQTEEIQEINSDNEIQVTNLKSLEITTNMVRKQNQQSISNDIAQQKQVPQTNLKTKKIKSNESRLVLSNRDKQIFQEFLEVIRITKDRSTPNGDKDYRWKLGTINIWRNINTALQINFSTFIRQSKKYQNIFKRYIPHQLQFKIELDQNKKKQETDNTLEIPQTKLESRKERRKKQHINNLVKIRQLFNKAQLEKLIDYERMIDEKGRSEALLELAQSQCSDYEPEQALLENMIEDIVLKTNIKQRKGSKIQVNDAHRGQIQAKNQLVIYNLTKASRDFNYIHNMTRIFNFYRRVPSLSCLGGGSLGLRSNNCKIIDQSTYLLELKQIQLRDSTAIIPDNNSLDLIKFQRNSALFSNN